jgi:hypothetical protein
MARYNGSLFASFSSEKEVLACGRRQAAPRAIDRHNCLPACAAATYQLRPPLGQ